MTPEPFGSEELRTGAFVVQKHHARSLHYDLRLELDGVLLSWAVPKGPSLNPEDKRLAIRTEDHPVEYSDFEAVIPPGNYGAGAMIVWDMGTWIPVEDPRQGLEKGKLLFDLRGYKLKGRWTVFLTSKGGKEWLLMKKPDFWADSSRKSTFQERSVLSGLTVEELAQGINREEELVPILASLGAKEKRLALNEVELMLARRMDEAFNRKGWIFEVKYDGYRLLIERSADLVRLRYRKGQDVTRLYPELARAVMALPVNHMIADGELVVLDHLGKPNFQKLQERAQRNGRYIDALELPATLFLFDLLGLDGYDLRELPLFQRKKMLAEIIPRLGPLNYVEHYEENGIEVFEQVSQHFLEGVMAKRSSSLYRAGRSDDWIKIPVNKLGYFAVVGFTEPKASRAGFGALHLAARSQDELVYCGRVGTGFDESQLSQIRDRLSQIRLKKARLKRNIPEGAQHHWVEPKMIAEVRFKEWTEAGMIRHPSFQNLREDLDLSDCTSAPSTENIIGVEFSRTKPKKVVFSNLSKILWEDSGHTKGDLINYYREISGRILPYLKDRFLVMDRYPDGIDGKSFFQKNAGDAAPNWVKTEQLWDSKSGQRIDYIVCSDQETLLLLANWASIPIHIWASRVQSLLNPDWCILDLDPTEATFEQVTRVALEIRSACEKIGIRPFVKTSGGKGLHILVPTGKPCNFDQSRMIAEVIALMVVHRIPDLATVERGLERRAGKVYIDCLQNGYGKLLVAPFCVRPFPGAPVSTPLEWDEVNDQISPMDFNIRTVLERITQMGYDPLEPIFKVSIDLPSILERVERILVQGDWFE